MLPNLLPGADKDLSAHVAKRLKGETEEILLQLGYDADKVQLMQQEEVVKTYSSDS